jgi:hypothetical protein
VGSVATRRWRAAIELGLRAVTSVTAVLSLPATTVRLAGREVTRFGSPSVHAALGLEWAL